MGDNRDERRLDLLMRTLPRLGRVLMVLAGLVGIFIIKVYAKHSDMFVHGDNGQRGLVFYGLVVSALALGVIGSVLTILPRKLALRWGIEDESSQHPRADLADDEEGSVLFLRSFRDDKDGYLRRAIMPILSGMAGGIQTEYSTLEEDIVAAISPIGPVVAIERPGERMPCLGAQRVSVIADDWRDEVDRRAMSARLVVLRYGETEGVHWEIERMLEIIDRRRLLIFVKGKRAYKRFANKIEQFTGQPLATPKKKLMVRLRSTGLFICFSDRGTPSALTTAMPPKKHFTAYLNGLRWSSERTTDFSAALTPLYKRFKVEPPIRWEATKRAWIHRLPWGRILLVLAGLTVALISFLGIMRLMG